MTLTPETHPKHFRTILVGEGILDVPYEYKCPYPSVGLEEDKQKISTEFWRSEYRRRHPEALKGGKIVTALYQDWLYAPETPAMDHKALALRLQTSANEQEAGVAVLEYLNSLVREQSEEANEVAQLVGVALTNMLFIPQHGAPSITDDAAWYLLTKEQLADVQSFTKPSLRPNSNEKKFSAASSD